MSFFFVHGQGAGFRFRRMSDLASCLFPLFVAGRAGTRIAKPGKGVCTAMTVLPVDLHTRARGFVYPHRFGIGSVRIREAFVLFNLDLSRLLGGRDFERLVRHPH